MADELNPVAENEPETPAIETTEQQESVTNNEPEGNQPEGVEETAEGEAEDLDDSGGQEEEIELDTIELDGKAYQIPKALKPGFMMQADYTRKTQEVAEARRALEQGYEGLKQQAQAADEEMEQRAALFVLDAQLQQFANVNWDQLEAEDPMAAGREFRRLQQLEKTRGQLQAELQQKARVRSQTAQQETAQRFEQTHEWAKKNIKGWTPNTDTDVINWARSKGATNENILSAMSPMVYEMLYLARIGEQTLSKTPGRRPVAQQQRQSSAPPAPPANQAAKPTSTVGGKSNPSAGKSLSEMSMDEYVDYRKRQEAQRGR